MIIALEGIDRAGKTTLAKELHKITEPKSVYLHFPSIKRIDFATN